MILDKKVTYFLTVVEEGSFSAAARKLFLSQPTLSAQITLLENELGVSLFDRSGYRPVLTLQGHAFYDGCIDMLQVQEETLKRMQSVGKNTIRVGFNGASANRPLIDAIKNSMENKETQISFKKGTPEELVLFLENDKIDLSFGLESDYRHISSIKYLPIYDYRMSILCAKDYPINKDKALSLTDIESFPFEFLSEKFGKNYFKEFKEAYKADGKKLNIIKYADTYDELIFDLIMGTAITISSKFVINDPEIVSIPIKETKHSNRYVVAWNKNKGENPYPDFLDSLKNYFMTL